MVWNSFFSEISICFSFWRIFFLFTWEILMSLIATRVFLRNNTVLSCKIIWNDLTHGSRRFLSTHSLIALIYSDLHWSNFWETISWIILIFITYAIRLCRNSIFSWFSLKEIISVHLIFAIIYGYPRRINKRWSLLRLWIRFSFN